MQMTQEPMQEKRAIQTQPDDLQIVRGNYFFRDNIPRLTLSNDMLAFNNTCVDLLDAEYVNILVSGENKTIQIRKSTRYNLNSVRWFNVRRKDGCRRARKIKSRMFTALFFKELGFDFDHKYRLDGEFRSGDVDELIFYADDPQVFVLEENCEKKRFTERYPDSWRDSFGIPVREHEDHKLHNFEGLTVLDITLEKVTTVDGDTDGEEDATRINELTEKYVKEGGYYG